MWVYIFKYIYTKFFPILLHPLWFHDAKIHVKYCIALAPEKKPELFHLSSYKIEPQRIIKTLQLSRTAWYAQKVKLFLRSEAISFRNIYVCLDCMLYKVYALHGKLSFSVGDFDK